MCDKLIKKRYVFKLSDITEIAITSVTSGLGLGTCYVLLYYAIYNELLTESTSSLAIRLFALLGSCYLGIRAISGFITKINEILN